MTLSFARDDATWDEAVRLFPRDDELAHLRLVFDPAEGRKLFRIPSTDVLGGPPTPPDENLNFAVPIDPVPEPVSISFPPRALVSRDRSRTPKNQRRGCAGLLAAWHDRLGPSEPPAWGPRESPVPLPWGHGHQPDTHGMIRLQFGCTRSPKVP